VKHNRFHGHRLGLYLWQGDAETSGAEISLNDFTGHTLRAIGYDHDAYPEFYPFDPYTFETPIGFRGRGNYWDHPRCEDGGFSQADSDRPNVTDEHPYGRRVAELSRRELASISPCR
jgi:hypothetical protein